MVRIYDTEGVAKPVKGPGVTVKLLKEEVPKLRIFSTGTLGCSHHWIIEPNDGIVSLASCTRCTATREFYNFFPEIKYTGGTIDEQSPDTGRTGKNTP